MNRIVPVLMLAAAPLFAQLRPVVPSVEVKRAGEERVAVPLPEPGIVDVIVEFSGDADLARFCADLGRLRNAELRVHAQVERAAPRIAREYKAVLRGAALSIDRESLDALRALPSVKTIHRDRLVYARAEDGVKTVRAPEVWSALGARGAGIRIAVIDTGVDYRHPALGGGIGPGFKVVGGYDFVANDADPLDENGHGTHVAGIIAANAADLQGVAPDASILAYRVLNASGSGKTSDVIAAIERAVDPNGDGDPADHVDVINLSLGSAGTPDTPDAIAVNKAVAAGVVVCAAAGNNGRYLAIDSPGAASGAITVGSTENNFRISTFSSAGPSLIDYAIKPDLVAPGTSIRSTARNGGFVSMSGTSMATPHVAGIAALLRQLHPDWTASMIKAALIANTQSYKGHVMQTGSGRVDAVRAANAKIFVEPASLNFGLTDGVAPTLTSTRTLTLTNRSNAPQSLTLSAPAIPAGIALTLSTVSMNLAAGESRSIDVTIQIDNATVPFEASYSRGGVLEITGAGDPVRVAWAFVKGLRARVEIGFDTDVYAAVITTPANGRHDLIPQSATEWETLLPRGAYDVTVFGRDSRAAMYRFFLAAFEQQELTTHRVFSVLPEDLPHHVRFVGRDETGVLVSPSTPGNEFLSHRTIVFPEGSGVEYLRVHSESSITGFRTSNVSPRYAISGGDLTGPKDLSRAAVLHYRSIRGITGDVQRDAGGTALRPQSVSFTFPPFTTGNRVIGLLMAAYTPTDRSNYGYGERWGSDTWTGTIFLEPNDDSVTDTRPYVEGFTSASAHSGWTAGEPFRSVADRVLAFRARPVPPFAYLVRAEEVLSVGKGYSVPRPFFYSYGPEDIVLELEYRGALQDYRDPAYDPKVRVLDSDGTLLAESTGGMRIGVEKRVQLVIESDQYVLEGIQGQSRFRSELGGNPADGVPPHFTSLVVKNAAGLAATRVAAGSRASVQVSAMDYGLRNVTAHLKEGSLFVEVRPAGTSVWQTVPVTKTGEDYGTPAEMLRLPWGTNFEAQLQEAITDPRGAYDLRVSVEDLAGNRSETILAPAFVVDASTASAPGKRRSVGR